MSAPLPDPACYETALAAVAAEIGQALVRGNGAIRVRGVRQDSRRVQQGDLFVARKGEKTDGLQFVQAAIDKGAAAIMAQEDHAPQGDLPVPVLLVRDIRTAISQAASMLYGHPGRALEVVGITGTNGKTTTSYLVQVAIAGAGKKAAVLGTLGARFEGLDLPSGHTTPEADDLIRMAATLRNAGATHLVMEVSSHALAQHRADAMRYRVAAFTNLTRDHLDFHGTMEAYAQAKGRLFHELAPGAAVINVDDPFGAELARKATCPVLRVSSMQRAIAEIRPATSVDHDLRGIRCDVATPKGTIHLDSSLVGEHNLSNLLLTIGIVAALELPMDGAAQHLGTGIVVPGRLERCDAPGDDIVVLVDYAHTPDALQRALQALRPLTSGRLHCVFGCGGDRDRTKRAPMGEIAGRLADVAILTNDNPRSEPPESILQAVMAGLSRGTAKAIVEPDRAKAIDLAVGGAAPGEVVLIAGKGHEPYQILGGETRHFDDREEARRALQERREKLGRMAGGWQR
jgi:UDP-N-acetylmuramoyl-L-alanyl-D-glutamate--2,6-diaminopimelate ligase